MPQTVIQTRNQVDAALPALWNAAQAREATYFGVHGLYWQGLWTSTIGSMPADGGLVLPDVGVATPSYQPVAWPGSELAASIPYRIAIHQYVGPNGPGFVGIIQVVALGNLYQRSQDSGPEPYRTQAWGLVGPFP